LFRLERAAFRFFGLRSRAVHVNGWTPDGHLLCGRRALSKATDPGALDNLAAGGLGADEAPLACARRELLEEAGVAAEHSGRLQWRGLIHSRRLEDGGLHDELLHVYALRLPAGFSPCNRDGEVSEFLRLAPAALPARLGEFSPDAGAVIALELLLQGG
jgi:8-oxo-dGTP pyrophosphatase MutT (NUDIX family)